ncbi:hypothetical protein ACVWZ6_004628 [Bradyrhizobium sp. GM6.1]
MTRRRVKKVLMCPGARHAPLGLAAQLATTADRTVVKARSGLRSKVEWRLARTRACASARRLLHLHNRPLHMRPDFRSSLLSRKVLCHRSLRPICRPRRMAFQQQMSHHGAPQVRHYLQVTRRQRTPRPQRTDVSGAARPTRLFVRRPVSAVRSVIFCKGAHNGRPFGRHKTTVVTAHRSVRRRRPETVAR